jgi:glycosyltransferase involved in cell wall biosynthesis
MQANIFFSIVIPTYNRANFVARTIQSLLAQTYPHFEIIVVDDGSTDNTEAVVGGIRSDKVTYHKKKNGERAAARNFGARLAKGDYVNFFDSDDLAYPVHLRTALDMIGSKGKPEWFHLGYDFRDPEGNLLQQVNQLPEVLNERLVKGNVLSCNNVFIRRDVALQYPFNEDRDLSVTEDYELWMRLASRFPLWHTNAISSTVVSHDQRSVITVNRDKLIKRQELFLKYIWQDSECLRKFGKNKKDMEADVYTYIALHLALTKQHRPDVVRYLFKSVVTEPKALSTRRFWASLKHII